MCFMRQADEEAIQAVTNFKVWRDFTCCPPAYGGEGGPSHGREDRRYFEDSYLENGKPINEAKIEMGFVIDVTRWYGEEGKRAYGRLIPARVPGARQMVIKEPVGPSCAFVAWNFPGTNVIRKVAGALAAGCSMLIKLSEETPELWWLLLGVSRSRLAKRCIKCGL